MLGRFMFEPCHMDEVEFHAPPRESKSKRWLSFHPFSGYSILSALFFSLFLSFSPLLYSFSLFFILGCWVVGSPDCRVAGLLGCRVPLLLFPQAFRSVSGSVFWKQQESIVNFPDGNGNQLFTIQSLILQLEERMSEKTKSEKKKDPNH